MATPKTQQLPSPCQPGLWTSKGTFPTIVSVLSKVALSLFWLETFPLEVLFDVFLFFCASLPNSMAFWGKYFGINMKTAFSYIHRNYEHMKSVFSFRSYCTSLLNWIRIALQPSRDLWDISAPKKIRKKAWTAITWCRMMKQAFCSGNLQNVTRHFMFKSTSTLIFLTIFKKTKSTAKT